MSSNPQNPQRRQTTYWHKFLESQDSCRDRWDRELRIPGHFWVNQSCVHSEFGDNKTGIVSNKMEGEFQHSSLSSDLDTCMVACWYLHSYTWMSTHKHTLHINDFKLTNTIALFVMRNLNCSCSDFKWVFKGLCSSWHSLIYFFPFYYQFRSKILLWPPCPWSPRGGAIDLPWVNTWVHVCVTKKESVLPFYKLCLPLVFHIFFPKTVLYLKH